MAKVLAVADSIHHLDVGRRKEVTALHLLQPMVSASGRHTDVFIVMESNLVYFVGICCKQFDMQPNGALGYGVKLLLEPLSHCLVLDIASALDLSSPGMCSADNILWSLVKIFAIKRRPPYMLESVSVGGGVQDSLYPDCACLRCLRVTGAVHCA